MYDWHYISCPNILHSDVGATVMNDKQYLEAVLDAFHSLDNLSPFGIHVHLQEAQQETERRLAALKAQEDNIKPDMWEEEA